MAQNPSPTSTKPSPPGREAAETAKDKASELVGTAQDKVQNELDQQKQRATEALGGVTEALHKVGDTLRESDQDAFAHYADTAAEQIEAFTRSIRNRSVGELLDEAERFARRDAGLFIGGAFLVGVFGARFLKASAPDRFGQGGGYSGPRYGSGSPGGYGYAPNRYGSGRSGPGGYPDYDEPPYRVAHTPGGEMPSPPNTARTPTS